MPFLEAIRQVGIENNPEDVVYIHVTLLPYITGSNELKSKPTQHSVKELQSLGIKPDVESIKHAGYANEVDVEIGFVDSETINAENAKEKLEKFDGIIVPGGFGNRGIEGKIQTVKYARENNVPFLGICLGMQMAVVEFARDVLGYKDANSEEFDEASTCKVIHIMEDQIHIANKGGTMRLGAYPCNILKNTLAEEVYKTNKISERHRHRFEYNNKYREEMEKAGLICSGLSPDGNLVEIVELKSHPYFIASQFHPEFKSRPDKPHPLFVSLVKAAKANVNNV